MPTYLGTKQLALAQQICDNDDRLEGIVSSNGNLAAKVVLVAEAPGATEIKTGLPFTGRSGQELDAWLQELQLTRADIYITKTVFSRPFNLKNNRKSDRKPSQKEINQSAPILDFDLSHFPDSLIVPLGGTALNRLLGKKDTISTIHGQLITTPLQVYDEATQRYHSGDHAYQVFPLFHPSYIKRFPSKRPLALADLSKLKQIIQTK
ncbi:uracil-DNA glycosylase [Lentilactobacillus kribbianus]|uniref:uracil-DNA glycosylase n=1 Tax=Lentilactobacillus kribbianus TaxID=2729622 RepID=UPI00155649F6|nr:uracil-DNA glycosylase [Lentilactobacillus kribbianus]